MNVEMLDVAADMVRDALTDELILDDLPLAFAVRDSIRDLETKLADQRRELEQRIAEALPEDWNMIDGIGIVTRKRKWGKHLLPDGKDHLVSDVLASQRVDEHTGEVIDETPLEKVRFFWDLSPHGVRPAAMKERGLTLGDYVEWRDEGWKLDIRKEGS